jgi:hypothetical protein
VNHSTFSSSRFYGVAHYVERSMIISTLLMIIFSMAFVPLGVFYSNRVLVAWGIIAFVTVPTILLAIAVITMRTKKIPKRVLDYDNTLKGFFILFVFFFVVSVPLAVIVIPLIIWVIAISSNITIYKYLRAPQST